MMINLSPSCIYISAISATASNMEISKKMFHIHNYTASFLTIGCRFVYLHIMRIIAYWANFFCVTACEYNGMQIFMRTKKAAVEMQYTVLSRLYSSVYIY